MPTHSEIGVAGTILTATETVVAVVESPQIPAAPPVPFPGGGAAPTIVTGVVNVTPGTGATGVVVRVRGGTLAAPGIVGQAPPAAAPQVGFADTVTLAAGASATVPYEKYDTTGFQVYMVTVLQAGAPTAAGTVNSGSVDATAQ